MVNVTVEETVEQKIKKPKIQKLGIANIVLVVANTAYPWQMPKNCHRFTIQLATAAALYIATTKDNVNSAQRYDFYELKSGHVLTQADLDIQGEQVLWFAGGAGAIVQILMGT